MSKVTINESTKITLGLVSLVVAVVMWLMDGRADTRANMQDIERHEAEIKGLKAEISGLRQEVQNARSDLREMNGKLDVLLKRAR